LSKEDEQFGRGFHRVQELDGGKIQDLQKKLDKLRQINHSLEEQVYYTMWLSLINIIQSSV